MAPPSSSSGGTTSVQVAVRIRPTTTQDTTSIPARFQRPVVSAPSPNTVTVEAGPGGSTSGSTPTAALTASKKQAFTFDQVHPPSTTQYAMFTSTTEPLISRFVEGFNCTVLAYGQTSSGKTFTMTGVDLDADPSDPTNGMGIIPRAVSTIFQRCRELKEERGSSWNFSLKGSFIEIYNEDLIDLLSMDDVSGGRREVQIREDKDGHIIWSGLREVSVKNSNEVMNLIRQGASIRRTNETDMNAQSSRSHAIFSLTLTQRKFTGSGSPPRSASPQPPVAGGRSPSRLARPGSVFGSPGGSRLSQPPRPMTPGFSSSIKSPSSLRPASSLGFRSNEDEERGEWITIVSKFHFVDLAGSERLKRTAAQGDRVKEGISINSGLLALGNVISALGDPARAKSHTASHIPYRDSKLTRLLQDSLGGNAHTLMIACVSPAEYNAGETINTLKYANRARNIKNRAVVTQKEEGWDDIEWLQNMVTRLRGEVKAMKDGGATPAQGAPDGDREHGDSTSTKKVLAQMVDLQSNYEDLREKFVERTEELTRLRRELAEKQRASSAPSGTAKYEEIVGPVIEEYEKTISAMEAELSLNRAALRHTNELVEEKEEELAAISERHASTEMYVEELKARVAKLNEREASTEAYIHDLEEKIKNYDESSVTSSGSITDLRREISRYKDTESHSSQYIADLEARLARSDESVLSLQRTVEHLEQECDRRRNEAEMLQARLDALQKDGESWRSDLEQREARVRELELKMEEWEAKKNEAAEERQRLGEVVDEVKQARKSLVRRSLQQEVASTSHIPVANGDAVEADDATKANSAINSALERQLAELQETHAATLSDLSSVSAKYRDALREISDLAAQIQEAKLSSLPEDDSPEKPLEQPIVSRRRMPSRQASDSPTAARRLFFRHAASAESLHSRSLSQSVSLSQELSSVASRKTSFSSNGSSSPHSPRSRPNLSLSLPSPSHERSIASLEKEIMRLQEVLRDRENEITVLEKSLKATDAPRDLATEAGLGTGVATPPIANGHADATLSPETEHKFDTLRESLANGHGGEADSSSASEADENLERLNELMRSMAQKESQHRETVDDLTTQLTQIRRQHEELTTLNRDQTLNMAREIEGLQQERERDLAALKELSEREATLIQSIKDAEAKHASEVEQLGREHEEALRLKEAEVDGLITRLKAEHDDVASGLRARLEEASAALEKAHAEHNDAFGKMQAEHEEELRHRAEEVAALLDRTQREHQEALAKKEKEHEEALKAKEEQTAQALARTEEEYYLALTKLRDDHARALEKQASEAAQTLQRLQEEHDAQIRMADIARQVTLSESESSQTNALQDLQEEHALAISKKEADFNEDIARLKAEHSTQLASKEDERISALHKLEDDHTSAIKRLQQEMIKEIEDLKAALESTKQESTDSQARVREETESALQSLRESQASVLQEVVRGHEEEVATLINARDAGVAEAKAQADEELSRLQKTHAEELAKARAERQQAVAALNAELVAIEERHREDLESFRAQSEEHLANEREQLEKVIFDLKEIHAQELDTLKKDHDLLGEELASHKAAAEEFALAREATRAAHERSLSEQLVMSSSLQEELATVQSDKTALEMEVGGLQTELTTVREEKAELANEVAKLRAELAETQNQQMSLKKEVSNRDSLAKELEQHRSLLAEVQESLQRMRDEKDAIQLEKNRQDSLVRELEARIVRSSSPHEAVRQRATTGVPPAKLPPLSPPPSIPPPPAPRSIVASISTGGDVSPVTSSIITASSTRDSSFDTPATSVSGSVHGHPIAGLPTAPDAKLMAKVEEQQKLLDEQQKRVDEQQKHIEEQEAMIKTLNKQLTHCEGDLQTHMDLVNTLEASLGDAEKNLRKARMQATELARERDILNGQVDSLRRELADAKREVTNVRQSIVEEKQSLESRLDEERRQKERARAQLDSRMAELTKRKSKFVCM